MEFTVTWNEEAYGETEPQTVSMAEFEDDGIEGDWGIDEDGDFTIEHLENLEVGYTHTVYSPDGWSIKIIKINEVK
tara:strand:- start:212 stop:439 length:228 start_codon:yes stop_codon:yes gene_type:complete